MIDAKVCEETTHIAASGIRGWLQHIGERWSVQRQKRSKRKK
jgi:hypothetical protein